MIVTRATTGPTVSGVRRAALGAGHLRAAPRLAPGVALAVAGVVLLSGCTEFRRTILGEKRAPLDETQVVQVPPLAIPPDYELRPPASSDALDRKTKDERAMRAGAFDERGTSVADRFVAAKDRSGAYVPGGMVRADGADGQAGTAGGIPTAPGYDPQGQGAASGNPSDPAGNPYTAQQAALPSGSYPPTPGYGAYGATPQAYGAPYPQPSYPQSYGVPQAYGAPLPSQGYGGGYGTPTPSGYGGPTPSQGYGGYPQPAYPAPGQPGYGAPQAPQAYATPPAYGAANVPVPAPVQGQSAGERSLVARAAGASTGDTQCRSVVTDAYGRQVCADR